MENKPLDEVEIDQEKTTLALQEDSRDETLKEARSSAHTALDNKVQEILSRCQDNDRESLIELATSEHGLVSDSCRRLACKSTPMGYSLVLSDR
jgi:hypothetical protein